MSGQCLYYNVVSLSWTCSLQLNTVRNCIWMGGTFYNALLFGSNMCDILAGWYNTRLWRFEGGWTAGGRVDGSVIGQSKTGVGLTGSKWRDEPFTWQGGCIGSTIAGWTATTSGGYHQAWRPPAPNSQVSSNSLNLVIAPGLLLESQFRADFGHEISCKFICDHLVAGALARVTIWEVSMIEMGTGAITPHQKMKTSSLERSIPCTHWKPIRTLGCSVISVLMTIPILLRKTSMAAPSTALCFCKDIPMSLY